MGMGETGAPLVDEKRAYLDLISRGDRVGASRLVSGLVAAGIAAEEVISDVLVPAQAEVGQGWQDARWSIAMEHRATMITESVLDELVAQARYGAAAPPEGSAGRVAVLCAEGEWHTLPARMAVAVLRLRGADVTFGSASLPTHEVAGFLGEDPPAVVAVTCSLPLNLTGAWRTINAVRRVGARVVAGGRGFGPHGRWAAQVGADAHAPDFRQGADVILSAVFQPAPPPRVPVGEPIAIEELGQLRRRRIRIVEEATMRILGGGVEVLPERVVSATRDDLTAALNALESAVLVADTGMIVSFVDWCEAVTAARALPLSFVALTFTSLLDVLPDTLPRTRSMARAGLAACTQPTQPHRA